MVSVSRLLCLKKTEKAANKISGCIYHIPGLNSELLNEFFETDLMFNMKIIEKSE